MLFKAKPKTTLLLESLSNIYCHILFIISFILFVKYLMIKTFRTTHSFTENVLNK